MHTRECEAESTNKEVPSIAGKQGLQGLGWDSSVLRQLPYPCQALGYGNIYHNLYG